MKIITFSGALLISLVTFSQIPTNGLVGQWNFSGNADDETGNSNDGNIYGATLTADRCGNENSAYQFDGNDFIECTADPMGVTNAITVSYWYRTTSSNDRGVHVIKYSWTQDYGYAAQLDLTNIPEMRGRDGNGSFTGSGTNGVATNNDEWHHFVGIVDGSTWTTWIDTVMVGTTDNGHTNVDIGSCTLPLTFGRLAEQTTNGYQYYTGILDDIVIYNRAISQSEIIQLFNDDCSTASNSELENIHGNVYPNPTKTEFYVSLNNLSNSEITDAALIDVTGRFHDIDLLELQQNGTVDVRGLASGIYILNIMVKGARQSFRIIVE